MRSAVRARHGGEFEVTGWELIGEIPRADCERALAVIEPLLACAPANVVAEEIARLFALTRRRDEDQEDLTLKIAAFADELGAFPPDVVRDACRGWMRQPAALGKWTPAWAELRELCEDRLLKRADIAQGLYRRLRAQPKAETTRTVACAVWTDNRARLEAVLGAKTWATWLKVLIALDDNGEVLRLGAPTGALARIVQDEYAAAIGDVIDRRVEVVVFDPAAMASARARREARERGDG